MTETQNTEFKETWKDDYMHTLSAFANTDGGVLIIGKNDKGETVGINNVKYLLENLPNKISQKLGIYPSIELSEENNKQLVEIHINTYDVPISFNGKYYIRRGSTTQQLTDKELNRFLLQKSRTSWESLPEHNATIDDIDEKTIEKFKNLAKKRVLGIENEDTKTIISKLRLTDEKGNLKRAAILLFAKDPQKYYISSYFKIGRFTSLTDIVTDDVIEGNLFSQLNKVLEVLRAKYLRNIISGYDENWVRIEDLEYPYEAIREAVINTLIHKDYSGSHVQMRIYNNEINLWNSGALLEDLTPEKLKGKHKSVLRNELIANTFYKAGLIEAWGRGTINIINECKKANLPIPDFNENTNGFEIIFYKDKFNDEFLIELGLNERQKQIIKFLTENPKITSLEYCNKFNITKRTANRDLKQLIELKTIVAKDDGKNTYYQLIRK